MDELNLLLAQEKLILLGSYRGSVMSAVQKTRLSTKGQVILPKAMRDRKGWAPGTEFTLEETPQGVLLTPQSAADRPHTRWEDVIGILHRPGMKPITLEDMDEAVRAGAAERYRRSLDAGD